MDSHILLSCTIDCPCSWNDIDKANWMQQCDTSTSKWSGCLKRHSNCQDFKHPNQRGVVHHKMSDLTWGCDMLPSIAMAPKVKAVKWFAMIFSSQ